MPRVGRDRSIVHHSSTLGDSCPVPEWGGSVEEGRGVGTSHLHPRTLSTSEVRVPTVPVPVASSSPLLPVSSRPESLGPTDTEGPLRPYLPQHGPVLEWDVAVRSGTGRGPTLRRRPKGGRVSRNGRTPGRPPSRIEVLIKGRRKWTCVSTWGLDEGVGEEVVESQLLVLVKSYVNYWRLLQGNLLTPSLAPTLPRQRFTPLGPLQRTRRPGVGDKRPSVLPYS